MFISDLKLFIEKYKALQVENEALKKELKKRNKAGVHQEKKLQKKEKVSAGKEKTPSLF